MMHQPINDGNMIIVVDKLPGTAPQEIIDLRCRNLGKSGRKIKTRHKGDLIEFYFEELFDD